MFFTYVVRPGEAPEGRSPKYRPFWDACMAFNLRAGFAFQLIALLGLSICSLIGGNVGINLVGLLSANSARVGQVPLPICLFFTAIWTLGSLLIQGYRQLADDDASIKNSRGFRAGTKALHHATLLDAISWILTAVIFYATFEFFDEEWASKQSGDGSMRILVLVARGIHAFALILYGFAIFCLEGFHTTGTGEGWAWGIGILYKVAGTLQILTLAVSNPAANTFLDMLFGLVFFACILSSFMWAVAFEPRANEHEVKLSQSAMRNEFYKSKNAMAYYGPPLVQGGVEMTG